DRQGKVQTAAEKAKHNACIKQRIAGSAAMKKMHKARASATKKVFPCQCAIRYHTIMGIATLPIKYDDKVSGGDRQNGEQRCSGSRFSFTKTVPSGILYACVKFLRS
ncbi:MAG: hypothetical protein ACI3U1_04820, partial [Peptococcaceae bacterium]